MSPTPLLTVKSRANTPISLYKPTQRETPHRHTGFVQTAVLLQAVGQVHLEFNVRGSGCSSGCAQQKMIAHLSHILLVNVFRLLDHELPCTQRIRSNTVSYDTYRRSAKRERVENQTSSAPRLHCFFFFVFSGFFCRTKPYTVHTGNQDPGENILAWLLKKIDHITECGIVVRVCEGVVSCVTLFLGLI